MKGLDDLLPLSIDVILNNKVLGPAFQKKLEESLEKGLEEAREKVLLEGRQEGRMEAELSFLRRLLANRFGPLPLLVEDKLRGASEPELNDLLDRAFQANSIDELVPNS